MSRSVPEQRLVTSQNKGMQDEFPVDRYRAATAAPAGSWGEVPLHGGAETGSSGSGGNHLAASGPDAAGDQQQRLGLAQSPAVHGGTAAVASMQVTLATWTSHGVSLSTVWGASPKMLSRGHGEMALSTAAGCYAVPSHAFWQGSPEHGRARCRKCAAHWVGHVPSYVRFSCLHLFEVVEGPGCWLPN